MKKSGFVLEVILICIGLFSVQYTFAQTNIITTLYGQGTNSRDVFESIAVDDSGNVYIAAANNIRKVKPDGSCSIMNDAYSWGIALDAEKNVYFSNGFSHQIQKIDRKGIISVVAGNGYKEKTSGDGGFSGDGGPATDAELNEPSALTFDSTGNLYICDWWNHRIRKVDKHGIISTIAGSSEMADPQGIAVDNSGNIYFADHSNNRIRKINTNGIVVTIAGTGYVGNDHRGGYSGDGGPASAAELSYPHGIALDAKGNLYIADQFNHRIRKINSDGIISTIAGNGTEGYSGDGGLPTSAQISFPSGVAVDKEGNIYVSQQQLWAKESFVRKINGNYELTCSTANKVEM